jgi:hypothetical protein
MMSARQVGINVFHDLFSATVAAFYLNIASVDR